jgi:hypothetical protein
MRERIGHINRALLEDPSALREEGRLAGEAILWNLMALTDSTARLSDELKKRHPEIQWNRCAASVMSRRMPTIAFNSSKWPISLRTISD